MASTNRTTRDAMKNPIDDSIIVRNDMSVRNRPSIANPSIIAVLGVIPDESCKMMVILG